MISGIRMSEITRSTLFFFSKWRASLPLFAIRTSYLSLSLERLFAMLQVNVSSSSTIKTLFKSFDISKTSAGYEPSVYPLSIRHTPFRRIS